LRETGCEPGNCVCPLACILVVSELATKASEVHIKQVNHKNEREKKGVICEQLLKKAMLSPA